MSCILNHGENMNGVASCMCAVSCIPVIIRGIMVSATLPVIPAAERARKSLFLITVQYQRGSDVKYVSKLWGVTDVFYVLSQPKCCYAPCSMAQADPVKQLVAKLHY
jgi:hypothetical protein